jgi:hypothetical protein
MQYSNGHLSIKIKKHIKINIENEISTITLYQS